MCCCNLTKMSRVIATFGFVTCILIVNLLATDIRQKEDIEPSVEIILGLEWRDFIPLEDRNLPKSKTLLVAILIYTILHATSNLSLIFATIAKNHWFTLPWFVTQTSGIICQSYSLYVHCTQKHDYQVQLFSIALIYLFIATYFWIVVFLTQYHWHYGAEYSLDEDKQDEAKEDKSLNNSNWDNIEPYRFQLYNEIY